MNDEIGKLRFLDNDEKEFWKDIFVAALNSTTIQDEPFRIADYGVICFRERNFKDNPIKTEKVNDNK